ncbi:MAG: protease complex subunit PrcB family protein [Firmicutes bacterium]|mgnify:FL=1|nr:protease complex subunit PrcB family protein [Bacillota bacterium]
MPKKIIKLALICTFLAVIFAAGALAAQDTLLPIRDDFYRESYIQEYGEAIYLRHREVDAALFGEYAGALAAQGITVTHTGPFRDYVEIGITPYTEENAGFIYSLLGRELLQVVEGQPAHLLPAAASDTALLQQQIAKLEEALAAKDAQTAVKTWAEGVKTRNGALQYALLTPGLKAVMYDELSFGGTWTTGTSSPWVEEYEIITTKVAPQKREFQVIFTYTDSTKSRQKVTDTVTVVQEGENWFLDSINDKKDTLSEINFTKGCYRPDFNTLPAEIKSWVEASRLTAGLREKNYHGHRFVLVTAGEKPTGGYAVEIKEATAKSGQLEVKVQMTAPGKDDFVTTALTYPFDLVIVAEKELPLRLVELD